MRESMFIPFRARQLIREFALIRHFVFSNRTSEWMSCVIRHLLVNISVLNPTQVHFTILIKSPRQQSSGLAPSAIHHLGHFALGIDSCHNVYAVDDNHIMTVSSDGTRVWNVVFDMDTESVNDVRCVAYLKQSLPTYASRGDNADPSYLRVVDVCSDAVIMRSAHESQCVLWMWKSGRNVVVDCPDVITELYDHHGISHNDRACLVNATHQMFVMSTLKELRFLYKNAGADGLGLNMFAVNQDGVIRAVGEYSDLVGEDKIWPSPARRPFYLYHELTHSSFRSLTIISARYLVYLVKAFGFGILDLDSGHQHAFKLWHDIVLSSMSPDGNKTCSCAYSTLTIPLVSMDEATASYAHVVDVDTVIYDRIRIQPDYVLHIPIQNPNTIVRLAFMSTVDRLFSVVVDYDTKSQHCTLKQVFTWKHTRDASIVAIGEAKHQCAVNEVFGK